MKFLATLLCLLSMAAQADPAFVSGYSENGSPPSHAQPLSAKKAKLNPGLFAAETIDLTLPDGLHLTATRRIATNERGYRTWSGTTTDGLGTISFGAYKGAVSGTVNYNGATWEISPQDDSHQIYKVNRAALPTEKPDYQLHRGGTEPAMTMLREPTGESGSFGVAGGACMNTGCASAAKPARVDVLMMYTDAAAARWGVDVLKSKIATAIANSNAAATQSQAFISYNVIAIQPSPMQESGAGMAQTFDNLRVNPTAIAQRNAAYADTVMLISEDTGWCGYAGAWWNYNNGVVTSYDGFGVVYSGCLGDYTTAHEFGHTLGLDHNREDTASTASGYHYGYRLCTADGFRTIMAYACPGLSLPILAFYSNPSITYNGYPIGVLYSVSPATASENSRTLNEITPWVTILRQPPVAAPQIPKPPINLTVTAQAQAALLNWALQDNYATNVSVLRATYNVKRQKWSAKTTIATVPAATLSFTNSVASGQYRYSLIANNDVGSSAMTATVAVIVP